jgi:hypothetical protein
MSGVNAANAWEDGMGGLHRKRSALHSLVLIRLQSNACEVAGTIEGRDEHYKHMDIA